MFTVSVKIKQKELSAYVSDYVEKACYAEVEKQLASSTHEMVARYIRLHVGNMLKDPKVKDQLDSIAGDSIAKKLAVTALPDRRPQSVFLDEVLAGCTIVSVGRKNDRSASQIRIMIHREAKYRNPTAYHGLLVEKINAHGGAYAFTEVDLAVLQQNKELFRAPEEAK
tara:strand:- start:1449 stop:1952 length:504 start_codon:yes stop_codon:yes gene_type:complete